MDISKVFDIITPLMIISLMGVLAIVYGIIHPAPENNELQFILGVPIALGAAGFHFFIRWIVKHNTLYMWIIEAIIVGCLIYAYPKM